METILIKFLSEAFAAGGIYAVVAFLFVLVGTPAAFLIKAHLNLRKELSATQSSYQTALATCNEARTQDLKVTIAEATKCMQTISTTITSLMVAMELSTRSNDARVKSWETLGVSLELYGKALDNISDDLRDIRRSMK